MADINFVVIREAGRIDKGLEKDRIFLTKKDRIEMSDKYDFF